MSDNWQARMESKIDQLTEVVVQLAKHDERITNLAKRQDRSDERQTKAEARINEAEKSINRNTFVSSAAQWVVACIVGGVIATVIRQVITTV